MLATCLSKTTISAVPGLIRLFTNCGQLTKSSLNSAKFEDDEKHQRAQELEI